MTPPSSYDVWSRWKIALPNPIFACLNYPDSPRSLLACQTLHWRAFHRPAQSEEREAAVFQASPDPDGEIDLCLPFQVEVDMARIEASNPKLAS